VGGSIVTTKFTNDNSKNTKWKSGKRVVVFCTAGFIGTHSFTRS
jgi:hypothetical protein